MNKNSVVIKDNKVTKNKSDRLLELPCQEDEDQELSNIRRLLKEKYNEIKDDDSFINCYNDIIDYVLKKHKIAIIEGNIIQNINPDLLKGKIIIKRTAIIKSYIRAVKRDYKNSYFMSLEKEKHKYLYKLTRLYNIIKRRKSIFTQAKEIDKIINQIETKQKVKRL